MVIFVASSGISICVCVGVGGWRKDNIYCSQFKNLYTLCCLIGKYFEQVI